MQKTHSKKVIITGGAGLIGSVLSQHLGGKYEISSFDVKPAEGIHSFTGNLTNLGALVEAFANQDTVVHLAADRRAYSDWESNLQNNFLGTYNVFEAAKQCGIKRVIFASSNHATGGYYQQEPWKSVGDGRFADLTHGEYPLVDEAYRIRPDGYYGTAKAFGEAIGSYYTDYHGLSSLHLRIGWVISDDDPTFSPFALSLWLSHRDCAQIVDLCIAASESLHYDTFFATSDNKWKIFSIERAKRVLGFAPADGADEQWTERMPYERDR